MINAVCTRESWDELMGTVVPLQRFYEVESLNDDLVKSNGMPILFVLETVRIHFYPPKRTGDWATALIRQGRDQ